MVMSDLNPEYVLLSPGYRVLWVIWRLHSQVCRHVCPCRRLTTIAFSDMNPFPRRLLRNRRALHLERLQGELQELEEQQREFVTESAERQDKYLGTMVSEDDEELWSHLTRRLQPQYVGDDKHQQSRLNEKMRIIKSRSKGRERHSSFIQQKML